jgi:hypothetical protein
VGNIIEHFLKLFFFCGWDWDLNSGLAKQAIYCLNHTSSAFLLCYFGHGVS